MFDVTRLSAYRMLIPFFGVLESIIILKEERLTPNLIVGGSVLLFSIFLLEVYNSKSKAASEETKLPLAQKK